MSRENPSSEPARQVHEIMSDLNDPIKRAEKRLAENRKRRIENMKKELGL